MNRKTVATLKIKTSKDGKYCFQENYSWETRCPFLEDAYEGRCSVFGKVKLLVEKIEFVRHKNCIAGEVSK